MRKLKITTAILKGFDACEGARERFERQYPRGLVITDDQHTNFEILLERVQEDEATIQWGRQADAFTGALGIELAHALDAEWLARALSEVRFPSVTGLFHAAGELADAVGVYLESRKR